MAFQRDIMGGGLGAEAAKASIGSMLKAGVATGTNQATALPLGTAINFITTVPAGAGVVLPPMLDADLCVIFNKGANALLVYPPLLLSIDGQAVNLPVSVPAGGVTEFWGSGNYNYTSTVATVSAGIAAVYAAFAASSGSSLLGDAGALTGAVARTQQAINREVISLTGYGISTTNTGAQNTAALLVLLGNLTPGTLTGNRLLGCPAGQYDFTEVDFPNSLSNLIVRGEGKYTTRFNWVGANAVPMFKLPNARYVRFESLALINSTGNVPTFAIQVNRTSGQVGAGAATGCSFKDMFVGGAGSNAFASGIGYTCDAGQDSNNDLGTFENIDFVNMTNYGLAFQHQNSLVHQIKTCSFSNCLTAAISNVGNANSAVSHMGGSFSAHGCVSSGCGAVFELYGALHGINATGWVSENDVNLLAMPFTYNSATGFIKIALAGCEFSLTGAGNIVVFDAGVSSIGTMDILGCGISGGAGATLSFPSTGSRVNITGGSSAISTISYNNEVTIRNWYQSAGAPTYTNLGTGTLRLERSDGGSRINVMPIFSSGATPSVNGLPGGSRNIVYLIYGGATNLTGLTDGLMGDEITFYASNGNATLVHGGAAGNFRLKGAANVTLTTGNVITFVRLDTVTGAGFWVETARNF